MSKKALIRFHWSFASNGKHALVSFTSKAFSHNKSMTQMAKISISKSLVFTVRLFYILMTINLDLRPSLIKLKLTDVLIAGAVTVLRYCRYLQVNVQADIGFHRLCNS